MTEQMTPDEVLTSPRDCTHRFGINPYRCDRCKWDFRSGEPPMTSGDVLKSLDWMIDTRTLDSKEASEVRAAVAAMIAERDALLVAAECYRAIGATPMAYDVLKRHGLTAGESPYNFCNRMHDEALARSEAGHG